MLDEINFHFSIFADEDVDDFAQQQGEATLEDVPEEYVSIDANVETEDCSFDMEERIVSALHGEGLIPVASENSDSEDAVCTRFQFQRFPMRLIRWKIGSFKMRTTALYVLLSIPR